MEAFPVTEQNSFPVEHVSSIFFLPLLLTWFHLMCCDDKNGSHQLFKKTKMLAEWFLGHTPPDNVWRWCAIAPSRLAKCSGLYRLMLSAKMMNGPARVYFFF